MKRIFVFVMAFAIASLSMAADAEKEVTSTIQSVKVFRQGAQVMRTGKTSIPVGQNILKFVNLSPDLDPQSIQLKANGEFTVLSVNHQLNYLKETEQSAEYKKLIADRDALQDKLEREQVALQVLTDEENLILSNKDVGGTTGASVEKIKAMAEYYRTRLAEIKLKKLDITSNVKKWQEDLAKIQKQINDLSASGSKATSEILVKILAKAATNGEFELGYLVRNAGWYPTYDLRVKDIQNPVELAYKANVYQNSGEDWNKIALSLSTGNPSLSGIMPNLQTWRLRFYDPMVNRQNYYNQQQSNMMKKESPAMSQEAIRDQAEAALPSVEFSENSVSFEFKIDIPYDIPSDAKYYTVNVNEYTIPAYYEYYAAPKLDKTAYLTAQLTNWDQYNLLNGEANLYFEGTYLGKSFLDVQSTEDTLTLSLGRDESVVITRTKEKQFAEGQFIGNKKTETRGWDIELRNKKKQKIAIVVEDQYPLSTNDDIEVTLDNAKGAEVNTEAGLLKWKLNIEPGKAEKLNFRYSVKYPKKQRLVLE
ncbi:MAG: DUF4139 domain-containing protein [Saprospiraceae bacterium]